jgi:predicted small lipoprotein YifL
MAALSSIGRRRPPYLAEGEHPFTDGRSRRKVEAEVVRMRRMGAALLLALVFALAGCGDTGLFKAPSAPPTTSAPTRITMPDVVGQNADVARDGLHKLGLKNIDLGTVDGHKVVVLPQNWTVKAQSAKPGTRLDPDAKIVLGCARIGGSGWF